VAQERPSTYLHTNTNTQPRGFGWRIHCGVEVTVFSTNKQHTLSLSLLPAGASARVNVAIGCFILYPFFCFRLPLLFLASRHFPPRVQTLLLCSPPSLVALGSTQPNLFVSGLHVRIPPAPFHPGHPTRRCRSLLVPPEPDCSSACIWEDGRSRHRRLSLQLCRRE
jgi:hypothetical protein